MPATNLNIASDALTFRIFVCHPRFGRRWGLSSLLVLLALGLQMVRVSAVSPNVSYPPDPYLFTTLAAVEPGTADGAGSAARFDHPLDIAQDRLGNLYISDVNNNTIRQLSFNGSQWVATTIAGTPGVSGSADGTNGAISFNTPGGVAVDSQNHLYVADLHNGTIRKLTLQGTNWVSSTIAGTADMYGSAEGTNGTIQFDSPNGIALDGDSTLYVADGGAGSVRRLTLEGTNWVSSTISTDAYGATGIAVDSSHNVYVSSFLGGTVIMLSQSAGNWQSTTIPINFYTPYGLTVDNHTNIYLAQYWGDLISIVSPVFANGVVSTWTNVIIAGQAELSSTADGIGTNVLFYFPAGILLATNHELYIVDSGNNTIRSLTPIGNNWVSATLAGLPSNGTNDGVGDNIQFRIPHGITRDPSGNLFIADTGNSTIRKLNQTAAGWNSSTIAGQDGIFAEPQGIVAASSNNLYVADTDNHLIWQLTLHGGTWAPSIIAGSGAGGFADGVGTDAQFNHPQGLASDGQGNLYVADQGNSAIRKLTRQGANWVTTTIGTNQSNGGYGDGTNSQILFSNPSGVAVDQAGNVYVADTGNGVIRKIVPVGANWVSTTIAGVAGDFGSADGTSEARFGGPVGIAVDSRGYLYVVDYPDENAVGNTIREIKPTGAEWVVTTIGGQPGVYSYADGTNSAALFNDPFGIAVDNSANVYVADAGNNAIREGFFGETAAATGALKITISPAAAVSAGAQWQVDGGAWEDSGSTVSGLSVGAHTVSFSSAKGWTAPASQSVLIVANQTASLTASYSRTNANSDGGVFAAAKGTYVGLFSETNEISQESSGAFTVSITTKGSFSGTLHIGNKHYAFNGKFADTGLGSATAKAAGETLSVTLAVDLTGGSGLISGSVSNSSWVAQLVGYREVASSTLTGHYTLAIMGTNSGSAPGGDGFATITVSRSGELSLSGTLADGAKISASSGLSQEGYSPLYVPLYGGKGSLWSWLIFASDPTQALGSDLLNWYKPPGGGGKAYPGGFTLQTTATGSSYTKGQALSFTNALLILQGGGLSDAITNPVVLDNNKLTVSGFKKPVLSFSASLGTFSGSWDTNGSKLSLKGTALQKTNLATGFFLNNGQSGQVLLVPASSSP